MGKECCCDLNDLLKIFEDKVTAADLVSSRVLSEISAAIVKYRVDHGMTQQEFAKYMNVSQGMVSKWESSDYNFSIKTLADITVKLDLELKIRLQKAGAGYSAGNSVHFISGSSGEGRTFRIHEDNIRRQRKKTYLSSSKEKMREKENSIIGGFKCYSL